MQIINDNTVVVFSYAELKTALEQNNNYTYVYLGADITLENGIALPSTKLNITIDGTYENVRHNFEDKKTLATGDTIQINAKNNKITVCNMNITGNNYYGILYVPESASYNNVITEYKNIIYVGPQISFNANGITRFIDVDVTINDTSLTTGNEIAECNRVEIGGNSTFLHKSKNNSAFWFRNTNPYLKILENAHVTFTSENRELIYGTNALSFSVLSNAYFSVTSANGMAFGTYGTGTTLLDTNATFILTKTASNGSYPTWYSYGSLTLESNTTLKIVNNFTGINTSNYNIYFNSSSSSFNLNNPKEIVLYNTTANVIRTSARIPFTFTFTRINLFDNAIALDSLISTTTLPTYAWYKENETATISGTFNSTTATITSNNFTEEELQTLPSLTNFIFANKKIFSLGLFKLKIKAITDEDISMKGLTLPLASILITYNETSEVIEADESGAFVYNYETPLPIGTQIKFEIKENNNVLYNTKTVEIVYPGELTIENIPAIMCFDLTPISTSPLLCPKKEEINILVTDSRVNSTDWQLYVTVTKELTDNDDILPKALVFKENDNLSVLSSEKTLVYSGTKNDEEIKTTTISWTKDTGILLQINEPLKKVATYKATLEWGLETTE